MEGVVYEGWMTKSPPEKRLWNAKWRQRWFVLKQSGQIPGQYVLEYYADDSYKKLKGRIDLDQCEQVDAGLSFETKGKSNKYMFDIKTSKRLYYLATNTESEMNKWVDCICSVCGLKIHSEESNDYRYSPQPSQEFMVTATTATTAANNGSNTSLPAPSPSPATAASQGSIASGTRSGTAGDGNGDSSNSPVESNYQRVGIKTTNNKVNPVTTKAPKARSPFKYESSGPYIPISECHSGRPIFDRNPLTESNQVQMPSIPTKAARPATDDCYDIPRQIKPSKFTREDILSKVPAAPSIDQRVPGPGSGLVSGPVANPPQVNWSTYPKEMQKTFHSDPSRASVRSCGATFETKPKQSRMRYESGPAVDGHRRSSTPNGTEYMNEGRIEEDATNVQPPPPPRPPKPPSLRRSKSKSESCASLPSLPNEFSEETYDVPRSGLQGDNSVAPVTEEGAQKSPSASVKSGGNPKPSDKPASVLLPIASPDSLYDFPRPANEGSVSHANDNLNAQVPVPSQATLRLSKQHSYSNAPVGYFGSLTKESVFNYDYRPSLPTSSDDQVAYSMDQEQPERSPCTPNSASYCNTASGSMLKNPPAVNRDLKPRRKGSDSDTTASPTTPTLAFHLMPPPAVTRMQSVPVKSFRKPGVTQLLNGTPPRIPSRGKQQAQHSRDPSTSEDDSVTAAPPGLRSSSTDEQTKAVPPPRKHFPEGIEIQYLDLDLDSDNNSSPRTPNSVDTSSNKSVSSASNRESGHMTLLSTPPAGSSASTVYKTVDFVKTEALNKLRLNLEAHRSNS